MDDTKAMRLLHRKALLLDLTGKLAALLKEDGKEFDSFMELALNRLDDYEKLNEAFPISQKPPQQPKELKPIKKVKCWKSKAVNK